MRYLRKKGFSLVELVVVIAVIALLLAMILPNLSTSDANKQRTIDGAKDFYTAAQHLFSKFSKVESEFTGVSADDTVKPLDVLCYDKEFGGNRPVNEYVVLCMQVVNSKVTMVDACAGDDPELAMMQVLSRKNQSVESGFEKVFRAEADALLEASDGFYYAIVRYDDTLEGLHDTAGNNLVKVVAAGYGDYQLRAYTGDVSDHTAFENYRNSELLVSSFGQLANGDYFGIQSSEKIGDNYIGEPGTYFAIV